MLYYGWYAEAYGWTPEQVEALPHWYADDVRVFRQMVQEVTQEKAEADRKAAK